MDSESKQGSEGAPAPEEEVKPDRPKAPISRLVEMVPSASSLREERRPREKRIRLRYDPRLKPEEARISPSLAKELGIEDFLEITVAHRHRFAFKAIIDEEAEPNRVYVNPDLMEEHGIADNSIATVRPYRGGEKLGVRLEV
ncbi:conserved hypothetical protein [Aeropyrum pernix K1]|uniref:Uncharacterized protein n=2 Tax=Aeropyrum pernix TaxID=56636 RepID=Q9YBF3_AERPE|nr:hypothetical protein [Aeropyrum pernix]BAA80645.2 conserved hypothetical protein [Aeropyrum pernix K1]GBF09778.1 conserved hypothetical protein [Aeropyrum pernix]